MEKLPVGTKVLYNGKERTILAYTKDHNHFLVDNFEGGHDAKLTWYDENHKVIPYVKGKDDRLWLILDSLRKCTILSKKEPEFIFGL